MIIDLIQKLKLETTTKNIQEKIFTTWDQAKICWIGTENIDEFKMKILNYCPTKDTTKKVTKI